MKQHQYNRCMYRDGTEEFLPAGLDTSGLTPIRTIGSKWVDYLNPHTGEVHRSEAYYKKFLWGVGVRPPADS